MDEIIKCIMAVEKSLMDNFCINGTDAKAKNKYYANINLPICVKGTKIVFDPVKPLRFATFLM